MLYYISKEIFVLLYIYITSVINILFILTLSCFPFLCSIFIQKVMSDIKIYWCNIYYIVKFAIYIFPYLFVYKKL